MELQENETEDRGNRNGFLQLQLGSTRIKVKGGHKSTKFSLHTLNVQPSNLNSCQVELDHIPSRLSKILFDEPTTNESQLAAKEGA